jgi:hypothetical protein
MNWIFLTGDRVHWGASMNTRFYKDRKFHDQLIEIWGKVINVGENTMNSKR